MKGAYPRLNSGGSGLRIGRKVVRGRLSKRPHMRFEADVHKALQESLKEMMGEFSGHELADFTSPEGSLSPSHSMDASGDGSKANSRRPSISEARGSSAASGMSQRLDTEGYSLETKKDS